MKIIGSRIYVSNAGRQMIEVREGDDRWTILPAGVTRYEAADLIEALSLAIADAKAKEGATK